MLTTIATGLASFLAVRPNAPFVRNTVAAFAAPPCSDDRLPILSPRVTAAVARHRRP